MNLICAVCPGCLTKLGLAPDDQCPTHRLHELREEKPTVGFNCDHHGNTTRTKGNRA